jgi:hypothetical protein
LLEARPSNGQKLFFFFGDKLVYFRYKAVSQFLNFILCTALFVF